MNYKIITPKEFVTTHWSGGTTTELYIFPEDANFKSRAFDFRLSIATINVEESTFTPLQDIDRTLLLLEGELELIHEGHHSAKLLPLMQDSFSGGWQTKCFGTGKDFNLMSKGCETSLKIIENEVSIASVHQHLCVYVLEGDITIHNATVPEGSLIVITENESLQISCKGKGVLISID